MSHIYAKRKGTDTASGQTAAASKRPLPDAHPDALRSGTENGIPAAADLGHRLELSGAIRAKMEAAFGADLSAVKLYQSQAVADAGAQAVARGDSIAFAPGKADFSTRRGQELLGHELSHVMSQARGEVRGSGYLHDATLEARADREGVLAAGGRQVYTGPVTSAMSDAAPSLSMAGPMQASREDENARKAAESMVSARELQQRLDTGGGKATEKEVDRLAEYQQNLGAVQLFQAHQGDQHYERLKAFQRGRRIQGHLAAMRAQAVNASQDMLLPDAERSAAAARLQTLAGVDEDVTKTTRFAPEFEILQRSHKASKRQEAYQELSESLASDTDSEEQMAITDFIETSAPNNALLRGERESGAYPETKAEKEALEKKNGIISDVLDRHRLEHDLTTYRGVDDIFLRKVLADEGFKEALTETGDVNHEWIGKNMAEFNRRMTGAIFHDRGFMSTTTEPDFAEEWSNSAGRNRLRWDLDERRARNELTEEQYKKAKKKIPLFGKTPGTHVMQVELPKGAAASAIDGAGCYFRPPSGQFEVVVDKGGMYEFAGVEPGKVPGSYQMKIRLVAEEARRRRKESPEEAAQRAARRRGPPPELPFLW